MKLTAKRSMRLAHSRPVASGKLMTTKATEAIVTGQSHVIEGTGESNLSDHAEITPQRPRPPTIAAMIFGQDVKRWNMG
jgi:hypothetical protein